LPAPASAPRSLPPPQLPLLLQALLADPLPLVPPWVLQQQPGQLLVTLLVLVLLQ
jgi:hypothetical protein